MIIEPNENLTDANILLANEKLCKTVGKLEEEIVGRSILSVLGPDLSATWLNWTVATNTVSLLCLFLDSNSPKEGKPCRFDLDYDGVFTEAVVIQNGRNNYICMANNSIKVNNQHLRANFRNVRMSHSNSSSRNGQLNWRKRWL